MFYYGFSKDTKVCQFSADGEIQEMDGMVILTSETMYTDISRLTYEEKDGTLEIIVRDDTVEEIQARFENQRQALLNTAATQINILQDVMDYGDKKTAEPLYEAWRKYRAEVWELTYEAYQANGWPTKVA